jgi:hypothetical protein
MGHILYLIIVDDILPMQENHSELAHTEMLRDCDLISREFVR